MGRTNGQTGKRRQSTYKSTRPKRTLIEHSTEEYILLEYIPNTLQGNHMLGYKKVSINLKELK